MKQLRTAQVCVIDDEEDEYRHLITALDRLGLGCVHVAGDKVEDLPEQGKPFHGLRLVFLDMHLGTGGSDARAVTAHTANVFSRVVSPESAPVVVIVWTKYADYVASFRQSLFQAHPEYRGRLFFVRLEKLADASKLNAERLQQSVHDELARLQPLPLLWGWDALVQQAACGVTAEMCRLAFERAQLVGNESEETERAKMLEALNALLRVLIAAGEGKTVMPERAPDALLNVLAPLHFDRLENLRAKPELEGASDLMREPAHVSQWNEAIALNSMLLIGAPQSEGQPFRPGTLYKITNPDEFKNLLGMSLKEMTQAICQPDLLRAGNESKFETWLTASCPILLEVSPACDYANQKRPLARLVGGFLVQRDHENQVKKVGIDGEQALRKLHKVRVPTVDPDRVWRPVLSSQLVFSFPESAAAPFLEPVGRLKDPSLSDLRNWLSAQNARTGYLSVKEPS